jgi:hypothetical protein
VIHLHTGLPGAGKTLCTIVEVNKRAEAEGRTVYYDGIADLKLPWVQLESAEAWHTLPKGSIVVIDEAQRVFRPRHTASAVPEHVAKLETHRHQGIDLYIITQHPKLVDSNVRRLVGQHVHFVRAFGAKAVTRHQWGEVKDDPSSRDDSIRTLVPYPKEAFAWYKSAEVHTHKMRVPARVLMLLAIPVLIGGLAWVAWSSLSKMGEPKVATTVEGADPGKSRPPGGSGTATSAPGPGYIAVRQPRIEGLPHTAPVYDSITTPTTAPYPAACIASAKRCSCYSQQGTRIEVPEVLCRQIVDRGFFREWTDEAERTRGSATAGNGDQAPARRADWSAFTESGTARSSPGARAASRLDPL